jgi:hypothetical protein
VRLSIYAGLFISAIVVALEPAFWTGILLLRGDAPFAPIKTQEEKR